MGRPGTVSSSNLGPDWLTFGSGKDYIVCRRCVVLCVKNVEGNKRPETQAGSET